MPHPKPGHVAARTPLLLSPDGGGGLGAARPPADEAPPKIQAFEQRLGSTGRKHEDSWKRSPNATGQGAIHVKTFHCKLADAPIVHLNEQINEWVDTHADVEIKFATTTVGVLEGKHSDPHLIVIVFY